MFEMKWSILYSAKFNYMHDKYKTYTIVTHLLHAFSLLYLIALKDVI